MKSAEFGMEDFNGGEMDGWPQPQENAMTTQNKT